MLRKEIPHRLEGQWGRSLVSQVSYDPCKLMHSYVQFPDSNGHPQKGHCYHKIRDVRSSGISGEPIAPRLCLLDLLGPSLLAAGSLRDGYYPFL